MYKCNSCGAAFEVYDTVYEENGEKWYVCPYCRDTVFSEAKICEYCGNYFTESRMDVMCEDCLDELHIRFSNMLHNNFTGYEIEALNVIYDGKNLE